MTGTSRAHSAGTLRVSQIRFGNGISIFFARERENVKILPVIMCGGAGTRVWPESRESLPKQFISLVGPHSTFQMVTEMLADDVFETPIVISNHDYRFLVAEQWQKIKRAARIVLEPIRRDSGPAVAVAAELAAQSGPDTIVAVLAADHVVQIGRA